MFNPTRSLDLRSLCAALALIISAPPALAGANPSTIPFGEATANSLKSALRVSDLSLQQIDNAPTRAERADVVFSLDGQSVTLSVYPHSVRAQDFQVLVDDGKNGLTAIDPGPARTIRGILKEFPEAVVTGSITAAGMDLRIQLPSGKAYGLTAARRYLPSATAATYALYDLESSTERDGACGSHFQPGGGLGAAEEKGPGDCEPVGPFIARIGCDTEAPFIATFPGTTAEKLAAATQWIEDNVNEINAVVYELPPLSTTHVIARIVLRTAANDIYADTASGNTVLSRLRTEWRTTQADADAELATLWLGRNLDGNIVGLGSLGGICSPSGCWVEKRFGNQRLNLLAHEIGHNWGTFHCDQMNGTNDMCTVCTSPCPIMRSILISCSNPEFSQCSLDEILSRRPAFACIEDVGFVAPTVLDGTTVLNDGDLVTLPEALTGQTSSKTLQIRNNQNCTLPIQVRVTNATAQFTLSNPPTSIPPLGTVPIVVEFSATFAGDYTANLEITTQGIMSGYDFSLDLEATAGVGTNLPGATGLLCPLPWATTPQPEEVDFQWSPTDFVESFQFQILSSTDQVLYNKTGIRAYSERPIGLSVPVGQSYLWKVTAHNVNGSTPVASGFVVDPSVAVAELDISYRNIPIANNPTLNLPLNPIEFSFDFDISNDTAVELNVLNVLLPDNFSARFVKEFGSGTDGFGNGELSARVRPCSDITLRMFSTLDPGELGGTNPIMGTLEFDTNDPAIPHFTLNLCFRCEPLSCVGDPFSGCGVVTHVTQGGCWHFVADCGTEFGIRNFGNFSIGDTIWVAGAVDPDAVFCFPQVQLPQIPDPRVGTCITVIGELLDGDPCFVEPCPMRLRTGSGVVYDVENTVGFQTGDRVTVTGGFQPYYSISSNPQGLIFGNTIERAAGSGRFETGG
ncbi:MAG: hypothetical protein H6819_09380 [Phycisphaerales bacterium]|nr:hypothetical protein [Phycisphaerales bacterium]MCB9855437.1 hypothetical protein [Phycisphaerales bacterium]